MQYIFNDKEYKVSFSLSRSLSLGLYLKCRFARDSPDRNEIFHSRNIRWEKKIHLPNPLALLFHCNRIDPRYKSAVNLRPIPLVDQICHSSYRPGYFNSNDFLGHLGRGRTTSEGDDVISRCRCCILVPPTRLLPVSSYSHSVMLVH